MTGILILGEYINALGIARTASKGKLPIFVLDDHPYPICKHSRYCKPIHVTSYDDETVLNTINTLPEGFILIPIDDKWVMFLSKYKKKLETRYTVISPDESIVELCCNKKESYSIAQRVGIPVPQMYAIDDLISFPVVVKPSISYEKSIKMPHGSRVDNQNDLIIKFRDLSSLIGEENVIIQEVVGGGATNNISFSSYFKDGQFRATFCSRKLKQYPPEFGTGCIVEPVTDVDTHSKLQNYVYEFLHAIGYEGISEIEFMYDDNTHQFKFIEINPRFWMQHNLANSLGVNFMEPVIFNHPAGVQQNKDIIWVDELGLIRAMTNEFTNRSINVREYIKILNRKKIFGVLSFRDPLPACAQLKNLMKYLIRR